MCQSLIEEKVCLMSYVYVAVLVADIGMKKGTETGPGMWSSPIPVFPLLMLCIY